MKYTIGIDIGTSGTKTVLFDVEVETTMEDRCHIRAQSLGRGTPLNSDTATIGAEHYRQTCCVAKTALGTFRNVELLDIYTIERKSIVLSLVNYGER